MAELSCTLLFLALVAQDMRIVGIVKIAVTKFDIAKHLPNHDKRRAGDLVGTHFFFHTGQSGLDIEFVRPGRPIGNHHRAVIAIIGLKSSAHIIKISDRKMDRQSCP